MRRLLVTGGAGFVGSHFVRLALSQPGVEVCNLDLLTYAGSLENLRDVESRDTYRFVPGDIADSALLAGLLVEFQPTAVINFAAESHVDRSISGPAEFIHTNIVGSFALLEAVRGYWENLPPATRERFRFIQISTDEVYGALGAQGQFHETSPYAPNSPYAAAKAGADHLVRAWHKTYGLPILVTHGSNTYGPGQHPEKLIPRFINNGMAGQPMGLYGDGRQARDWQFVTDHCRGVWQVLERGRAGRAYNLGGTCELTNLEVAIRICGLLDELLPDAQGRAHSRLIEFVADRPGHDRRYAVDSTRARSELGWHAKTDFGNGLRTTVEWAIAHMNA